MLFKCDCFDYVSGESLGSFGDFFLRLEFRLESKICMMCIRPLSFNLAAGIGNEPAGSLFSKPT